MCLLDIFGLGSFVATTQEQDERLALLRVIHAVARTVVDAQLANALAEALSIAEEPCFQSIEPRNDARTRPGIAKPREPFGHRHPAVSRLVLADFHIGYCSPKATPSGIGVHVTRPRSAFR